LTFSLAVGVLCVTPSAAQQPTFRSGTKLVIQTVSVKDKDGKPIEGLTARDFVVTEDGEPQTVSFVEYQRLDNEAPASTQTTIAADSAARPSSTPVQPVTEARIAVSASGDIKYRNRRLVVLYFDMSALPPADLSRAYSAALTFIKDQMQAPDLLAIMSFEGGAVRVKQDFTDNRETLRDVINRMIFGNDLDGDGIPDTTTDMGTAFGQDDAEFNILNTDRQLSALQTAMSMLGGLPDQKSLVYFSSGLRLNGTDNQAQLRATTNAALRASVSIFPVDARGLVASPPLGDAAQRSPGGLGMFTGQLAQNMVTGFQRSQDTLYSLAKDTGGKAMFDYNDLSMGIVQAEQAVTSYYILGYYTTHSSPDGKFHRVKVSLRDGVAGELAYRQGYFADREFAKFTNADKERQLEEALMLDNPVTDITIAMEVNYFQLNRAEYFVPVAVKIPGSELALARRGGAQHTLIDFIGEVKDDYGITMQNVRDKLDIKLTDETASQLSKHPIQYETGFTLLPGKYMIKFLARDAETGRIGTFQTAFTIPNLNREEQRLPTSSVVLGSQRVALGDALYNAQKNEKTAAAAQAVDPLIHDGEKLIPSVTRVFSKNRDLLIYLQAYQRNATTTEPMVAFVSFYRGDVKVYEAPPIAVTDGLDARSKAVPVRLTVPLRDLPMGRYECQVSVLSPGSEKVAFSRTPIVVVQ
jgi:VWFA-related protein